MSKGEPGDFMVPLDEILAEGNIREFVGTDQPMKELIVSVKRGGVHTPVLLQPLRKGAFRYRLLAGFRRYTAACEAGMHSIPARVIRRTLTEADVTEIRLTENLHRLDMNPIEEARALLQFMEEGKLTQEAAAERLGRTGAWVSLTVRLLELPSHVQKWISTRQLSRSTGYKLLPYLKTQTEAWLVKAASKAVAGEANRSLAFATMLEGAEKRTREVVTDGVCRCACKCCIEKGHHAIPGF